MLSICSTVVSSVTAEFKVPSHIVLSINAFLNTIYFLIFVVIKGS